MSQLLSGAAAIRSLDAIRRSNRRSRSVGSKAWQDRSVGGNVLALPARTTGAAKPAARRTGQVDQWGRPFDVQSEGAANLVPPGGNPNWNWSLCSGREKMLSETQTVAAGATATFSLESPGAFCPRYMYVASTGSLADVSISSIKSGLEEVIISGTVPGSYFSTENVCCPIACFPCLCAPGVSLDIVLENLDDTPEAEDDITIGLIGDYFKVCPPNINQMIEDMKCAGGNKKLIGFTGALDDGDTVDFALDTPGRFCPTSMFLVLSSGTGGVSLSSAEIGLEESVIGDGFPVGAWANENETCCLPFCMTCLCFPGQTLNLTFSQSAEGPGPQTITGVIDGTYSPVAC